MEYSFKKENLSMTFLFSIYIKLQNNAYNKLLENTGIHIKQAMILLILKNKEYVYQKEISEILNMNGRLLTRYIRKLEDHQYIERIEDDENRRQNKIRITKKGNELANLLKKEEREREEAIMEHSPISREELIDYLLKIIEISKEYDEGK